MRLHKFLLAAVLVVVFTPECFVHFRGSLTEEGTVFYDGDYYMHGYGDDVYWVEIPGYSDYECYYHGGQFYLYWNSAWYSSYSLHSRWTVTTYTSIPHFVVRYRSQTPTGWVYQQSAKGKIHFQTKITREKPRVYSPYRHEEHSSSAERDDKRSTNDSKNDDRRSTRDSKRDDRRSTHDDKSDSSHKSDKESKSRSGKGSR